MYATPLDLVAHANRARLIAQLASNDYGVAIEAQAVQDYFLANTFAPENEKSLKQIESRLEQVIENATGEINGALAIAKASLPDDSKKTACMDLALFRLFENLDENSVIRINANRWRAVFNRLFDASKKGDDSTSDQQVGSAETIGEPVIFTAGKLEGY